MSQCCFILQTVTGFYLYFQVYFSYTIIIPHLAKSHAQGGKHRLGVVSLIIEEPGVLILR